MKKSTLAFLGLAGASFVLGAPILAAAFAGLAVLNAIPRVSRRVDYYNDQYIYPRYIATRHYITHHRFMNNLAPRARVGQPSIWSRWFSSDRPRQNPGFFGGSHSGTHSYSSAAPLTQVPSYASSSSSSLSHSLSSSYTPPAAILGASVAHVRSTTPPLVIHERSNSLAPGQSMVIDTPNGIGRNLFKGGAHLQQEKPRSVLHAAKMHSGFDVPPARAGSTASAGRCSATSPQNRGGAADQLKQARARAAFGH